MTRHAAGTAVTSDSGFAFLEIECRLAEQVTFAGEASPSRPATDITRCDPSPPEQVLAELRAAVLALRLAGYLSTTQSPLISANFGPNGGLACSM